MVSKKQLLQDSLYLSSQQFRVFTFSHKNFFDAIKEFAKFKDKYDVMYVDDVEYQQKLFSLQESLYQRERWYTSQMYNAVDSFQEKISGAKKPKELRNIFLEASSFQRFCSYVCDNSYLQEKYELVLDSCQKSLEDLLVKKSQKNSFASLKKVVTSTKNVMYNVVSVPFVAASFFKEKIDDLNFEYDVLSKAKKGLVIASLVGGLAYAYSLHKEEFVSKSHDVSSYFSSSRSPSKKSSSSISTKKVKEELSLVEIVSPTPTLALDSSLQVSSFQEIDSLTVAPYKNISQSSLSKKEQRKLNRLLKRKQRLEKKLQKELRY